VYRIIDDLRTSKSRTYLFEALVEITKTRKYSEVTVKDLAGKAGVSRSTFYRSFDDIDDVLQCMVDRDFSDLASEVLDFYRERSISGRGLRTAFVVPFLDFWDKRYRTVELVVCARKEGLLFSAFAREVHKLLHLSTSVNVASAEAKECFIAVQSGQAIGLLLHWIGQGRNPDKSTLANLVISQTLESFDMELDLTKPLSAN